MAYPDPAFIEVFISFHRQPLSHLRTCSLEEFVSVRDPRISTDTMDLLAVGPATSRLCG